MFALDYLNIKILEAKMNVFLNFPLWQLSALKEFIKNRLRICGAAEFSLSAGKGLKNWLL